MMVVRISSPVDDRKDSENFDKHHGSPQQGTLALLSDEEHDRAIAANPIDPRSWRSIQLYLICIVAYCNSGSTGLDGTLFGGMNIESPSYSNPTIICSFRYQCNGLFPLLHW